MQFAITMFFLFLKEKKEPKKRTYTPSSYKPISASRKIPHTIRPSHRPQSGKIACREYTSRDFLVPLCGDQERILRRVASPAGSSGRPVLQSRLLLFLSPLTPPAVVRGVRGERKKLRSPVQRNRTWKADDRRRSGVNRLNAHGAAPAPPPPRLGGAHVARRSFAGSSGACCTVASPAVVALCSLFYSRSTCCAEK